ncbi:putative flavonol 3-O-glucosyltransferase [Helianthus annuus]|uniref:Flavonol 3-O-glucosyltransferase n=1 Tax=Helianthus annuus TaxID=4232 RepID=A0A9K3JVV8_HELAN|nr:putative flavonol 3-O-glucosyltransferase [Helianthus annuus]KAJ0956477.1 putative flavonol 3-O-glucosyltransferase [Helianthus annuus]
MDQKLATEMACGLANSNQPFLWVVRPGSVQGYEWVLSHKAVGGFWSHCGWNSTMESVSEGVPMLCQPFSVDQLMNARYLSHVWKMGIEIVVGKREIESAIRRLLVDKEGEEMRKSAMEIQENVKLAVSHGGSTQNSLYNLVEFILSL